MLQDRLGQLCTFVSKLTAGGLRNRVQVKKKNPKSCSLNMPVSQSSA